MHLARAGEQLRPGWLCPRAVPEFGRAAAVLHEAGTVELDWSAPAARCQLTVAFLFPHADRTPLAFQASRRKPQGQAWVMPKKGIESKRPSNLRFKAVQRLTIRKTGVLQSQSRRLPCPRTVSESCVDSWHHPQVHLDGPRLRWLRKATGGSSLLSYLWESGPGVVW